MSQELVPMPASPRDLLRVSRFHPFEEGGRKLLYVVHNAAFCEVDPPEWALAQQVHGQPRVKRAALVEALGADGEALVRGFEQLEIFTPHDFPLGAADHAPLPMDPLSSLVLHVSHDCNMRCGYCYADFGRYGEGFGLMTEAQAVEHTERFFDQLGGQRRLHVTFFGGEPLMNMPVVYAAHAYAKARAEREGRKVAFGLTTNGTLLTDELVRFFEAERFRVTVSIDGPPDVNDRLRTLDGGGASYETIVEKVTSTGLHASARVTLTKKCLEVGRIVRHLLEAGFADVGVSPVATGTQRFDLGGPELRTLLSELEGLADDFVEHARRGEDFNFSNLRTLIEQIAAGDPRPVPCGAGTRLVAADDKGDLYACHRLVGQEAFRIGSAQAGVEPERRFEVLQRMHPRGRAPCESCWARYLCGGGCHHIAWLHSGEGEAPWQLSSDFCDFLRGWYRLGLYTYARLVEHAPEALAQMLSARTVTACSQPQGE